MEEQKQTVWGKYRGTYLGLDKAPKTGVAATSGKAWTLSKVKFTHAPEKEVTFTTFKDVTGLVSGQNYFVNFTKEEKIHEPTGTPYTAKQAIEFQPHSSEEPLGFVPDKVQDAVVQATQQPQTTQEQVVNNQIPKPQIDWKVFAEKYRDNPNKPISEKTLADFVGNCVHKSDKELFALYKGLYDEFVMPNNEVK